MKRLREFGPLRIGICLLGGRKGRRQVRPAGNQLQGEQSGLGPGDGEPTRGKPCLLLKYVVSYSHDNGSLWYCVETDWGGGKGAKGGEVELGTISINQGTVVLV